MKIFSILFVSVLFTATCIFAAPNGIAEDADQKAEANLRKALNFVKNETRANPLSGIILDSVDIKCMLSMYKEHDLMDEATSDFFDSKSSESLEKVDEYVNLAIIAFSCSNKVDPLLAFSFDNIFSYSGLIEAFKNDEPIKSVLDEARCFNKKAIDEKYLDLQAYPTIDVTLGDKTQEECDRIVTDLEQQVSTTITMALFQLPTDHFLCFTSKVTTNARKLFYTYGVLLPVGLNDEQKKVTRANFVSDVRGFLSEMLACNASPDPSTDDNKNRDIFTNEIDANDYDQFMKLRKGDMM